MLEITGENTRKVNEVAQRADKLLERTSAASKMGLYLSSKAWSMGKIEPMVLTEIPRELTPAEAKELGWALCMLGKYGLELMDEKKHEIPDEEFFAG